MIQNYQQSTEKYYDVSAQARLLGMPGRVLIARELQEICAPPGRTPDCQLEEALPGLRTWLYDVLMAALDAAPILPRCVPGEYEAEFQAVELGDDDKLISFPVRLSVVVTENSVRISLCTTKTT